MTQVREPAGVKAHGPAPRRRPLLFRIADWYRSILVRRFRETLLLSIQGGHDNVAMFAYRVLTKLDPGDWPTTSLIVNRLLEVGDRDIAQQCLERLLDRDPRDFHALIALARMNLVPFDEIVAGAYLEAAESVHPGHPLSLATGAAFDRCRSRIADSSRRIRPLLDDAAFGYEARCLLAQNLVDEGRRSEAVELLESAVASDPDGSLAYDLLASLKYYERPDHPHLAHLERLTGSGLMPTRDAKIAHGTLGRVYDGLGDFDAAFRHIADFNRLVRFRYDIDHEARFVDRIVASFTRRSIARLSGDDDRRGRNLIFVFGMPRSGTTLTEQVLASHPEVAARGETNDTPKLIKALRGELSSAEDYPECMGGADASAVARVAGRFLAESADSAASCRIVDKSLINLAHAGLLRTLFPAAKFVYCVREPLDTCLSCYFQNFEALPFTHDLGLLARTYLLHERLIEHWRSELGGAIFTVQYEELVRSPEDSIRRLLAHCGLDYDARCLDFHRTERVAHTASSVQVKSPLYTGAVGRWTRYRAHIQPLIEVLGEPGERAGSPRRFPDRSS